MLATSTARLLLVLHAIVGAAAVAAATHWVVWLWPLTRGKATRAASMRRFATIALVLYGLALVLGLVLYPTYKARVKLEYLTRPASVVADHLERARAVAELTERAAGRPAPTDDVAADAPVPTAAERASKIARWFDAKEHWAALGLLLGLAVWWVARAWRPGVDEPIADGPVWFVVLGAIGVAVAAWFAAVVGLVTTAARSF